MTLKYIEARNNAPYKSPSLLFGFHEPFRYIAGSTICIRPLSSAGSQFIPELHASLVMIRSPHRPSRVRFPTRGQPNGLFRRVPPLSNTPIITRLSRRTVVLFTSVFVLLIRNPLERFFSDRMDPFVQKRLICFRVRIRNCRPCDVS